MVITALYIAMVATDVASRSPSKGIAQGDHNCDIILLVVVFILGLSGMVIVTPHHRLQKKIC